MNVIELLKSALLGLVQGITEWLPISSTGHMLLLDEVMKLEVSPAFMSMFIVVIQLGSILALLVLYFNKLNPFAPSKNRKQKRETLELWFKVAVASVPAAIIGLLFDDKIEALFSGYVSIAVMLIVYGVLFIVLEKHNKRRKAQITEISEMGYGTAAMMGVFQVLALVPGTSRSGSTILGGILLGCSRTVAAEFSFFMAIPVMFGASLLRIAKFGLVFSSAEWMILGVGTLVAFIASILAIQFLMQYIRRNDFSVFGWYRIALGAAVLAYFFLTRA
jgi:undecaprenyl-diphosphatase